MGKTTGKLKYDLALTTTTVYDASSIYVNKTAELSIDGNANLQYKTIGATYADNTGLWPTDANLFPGPAITQGKAYLYVRNLGPSNAATLRVSTSTLHDNTDVLPTPAGDGIPDNYDPNQFADIAINEFAFLPVCVGASTVNIHMKSGYVVGPTWAGATYNEIEIGYFRNMPNIDGPKY